MGPHPEPAACVREKLSPDPGTQEPGEGSSKEPAACVRDVGKKKTRCATCPAQPRVRARRGEEKDTVRVLLTAGARACETQGRSRQGEPLCGRPPHHRLHRG